MIYVLGKISGAHFNPAVTVAFAARSVFPWHCVPFYIASQLAGAVAASLLLLVTFGNVDHLGATIPHAGLMQAFALEILLSLLLILVILGTACEHKLLGPNAALAVGGAIILCGLVGSPISGASMNPARSLGPALVSGTFDAWWIYLLGP